MIHYIATKRNKYPIQLPVNTLVCNFCNFAGRSLIFQNNHYDVLELTSTYNVLDFKFELHNDLYLNPLNLNLEGAIL